jgi:hypothetical protein
MDRIAAETKKRTDTRSTQNEYRRENGNTAYERSSTGGTERGLRLFPLVANAYKLKNIFGDWKLVRRDGSELNSNSYKALEVLGGHIIGTNILNYKILLQAQTGSESASYTSIHLEGRHLIAVDILNYERLLSPKTGNELTNTFKKIHALGDMLIGTDILNYEKLIHPTTGRVLSGDFKKIRWGAHGFEGINILGHTEKIPYQK